MNSEELLNVIDERITKLKGIVDNGTSYSIAFHNPDTEKDLISYISLRLSLLKPSEKEKELETLQEDKSLLEMFVSDLNINERACRCLAQENIVTVRELLEWSGTELIKLPNLGRLTLDVIQAALAEHGLKLRRY